MRLPCAKLKADRIPAVGWVAKLVNPIGVKGRAIRLCQGNGTRCRARRGRIAYKYCGSPAVAGGYLRKVICKRLCRGGDARSQQDDETEQDALHSVVLL